MKIRLEHANLDVRNLDQMVHFLQAAFPEFRVRCEGRSWRGKRWLHIGTDETYVALTEAFEGHSESRVPYSGSPGLNHLGYAVEDVDALRHRLYEAGYRDSTVPNRHPYRKRVYFYDAEGNDWEFVQYFSRDPAERNDYEVPDFT